MRRWRWRAGGLLNLGTAVPVSGSYHVADAAGLLWSLEPAFTSNPGTQFIFAVNAFRVRF